MIGSERGQTLTRFVLKTKKSEKLADHVTPDHHVEIGRIKDYGSAAVFCAICLAGLTWLAALAVRCGLI